MAASGPVLKSKQPFCGGLQKLQYDPSGSKALPDLFDKHVVSCRACLMFVLLLPVFLAVKSCIYWTIAMSESAATVDLRKNHDSEVISIAVVFTLFALLTVVARVLSKQIKGHQLQIDDYLLIAAWARTRPFRETLLSNLSSADYSLRREYCAWRL